MERRLPAEGAEQLRRHGPATPMLRRLDLLRQRVLILAQIRVMQKRARARLQHSRQFQKIRTQHWRIGMHQRIEAKREIDARILDSFERRSIVHEETRVPCLGEPVPARLDTTWTQIHAYQRFASPHQELGPPPKARRDFKYRSAVEKMAYPRLHRHAPRPLRAPPSVRPLIPRARPVIDLVEHVVVVFDRRHLRREKPTAVSQEPPPRVKRPQNVIAVSTGEIGAIVRKRIALEASPFEQGLLGRPSGM